MLHLEDFDVHDFWMLRVLGVETSQVFGRLFPEYLGLFDPGSSSRSACCLSKSQGYSRNRFLKAMYQIQASNYGTVTDDNKSGQALSQLQQQYLLCRSI